MEEDIHAEKNSYFPDFSDIYDESFQFWDFLGHKESTKKRLFDDEIICDDDDVRPNVTSNHSSFLKRDDSIQDSHTFWDFLNSGVENNKHSPISSPFDEIFSLSDNKVDEKLQQHSYSGETNPEGKVEQKYSSSDEFWDFFNSSVENKNFATSEAEKQLNDVPFIETAVPDLSKRSIFPRISSVFSIKTGNANSSDDTTSENIAQVTTVTNASTEVTHEKATFNNPIGDSKVNHYSDTLKLQDSVTNCFPLLRDSPAKFHNARSSSTPVSVGYETQNLQLTVVNTESVCLNNNDTVSVYVLLPNSKALQKSNNSQYLIITNNTPPQITLNKDEVRKNREQKIAPQNFSSENHPTAINDSFQSDLRLAGYRNNHVLNTCQRNRNIELPFDALNNAESKCSLPVSTMPLDEDTVNLISARVKDKRNNYSETIKKQKRRISVRPKPIKCIPLGRCKNAIQQTNTPISMDAFETSSKDALLKPCSKSKVNCESIGEAGVTPLFLLNNSSCQNYSLLPITFTQIPIWNGKHLINDQAKQNIRPFSSQKLETHDKLSILSQRASPLATKSSIVPESRQNKILLPKPPSFISSGDNKKVVSRTKKCRRKTVKELLQERQQNSKLGSEIANQKVSKISKDIVSDTTSLPDAKRLIKSPTECCDDPKNEETANRREGETTHKWPLEKSLRPRHYDMSELQIGFFKVQEDVDACGRFRSKFKVLFMKRQFLYDFPVSRCNQPSLKTLQQEWDDEMARIAVPFKTITSISLKDRIIYLKIDSTPQLSLTNTQSRFAEENNNTFWIHFLQSSFTHKVVLRKRQANKLKWILYHFDERFFTLTDVIFTSCENQFDSPVSFKKRFCKNRKFVARRLPESEEKNKSLLFNQMCSCRTNCRSIRCSCVKGVKSCSTTCQCTNCNNPLNVLETIGLDIHFSLKDSCLFQNIYQIPDLLNYLAREVRLDCCNSLARIQECIPGTVLCPNINCNASLQYSWCQRMVSYPERNPRNHCSLCGQCGFSNGRHCHACKKCYAVTSKSNKCPTCLKENLMHKQLCPPRRSLSTYCYDKKMMCTSSKPQIIVLNSSSKNTPTKLPEENKNHFFSETILKQNYNE